jgi:hypothetical protein
MDISYDAGGGGGGGLSLPEDPPESPLHAHINREMSDKGIKIYKSFFMI